MKLIGRSLVLKSVALASLCCFNALFADDELSRSVKSTPVVLVSNPKLHQLARQWFPAEVQVICVAEWCDDAVDYETASENFFRYQDFGIYLCDSNAMNDRERMWVSRLTCDLPDGRMVDVSRGWRPECAVHFAEHVDRRLSQSLAITLRKAR